MERRSRPRPLWDVNEWTVREPGGAPGRSAVVRPGPRASPVSRPDHIRTAGAGVSTEAFGVHLGGDLVLELDLHPVLPLPQGVRPVAVGDRDVGLVGEV